MPGRTFAYSAPGHRPEHRGTRTRRPARAHGLPTLAVGGPCGCEAARARGRHGDGRGRGTRFGGVATARRGVRANEICRAPIETGTKAAECGCAYPRDALGRHTLGVAASCGDAAVGTIVVRRGDFGPHFGSVAPMRFASHLRCRKVWPRRHGPTPMKRPAKRASRL